MRLTLYKTCYFCWPFGKLLVCNFCLYATHFAASGGFPQRILKLNTQTSWHFFLCNILHACNFRKSYTSSLWPSIPSVVPISRKGFGAEMAWSEVTLRTGNNHLILQQVDLVLNKQPNYGNFYQSLMNIIPDSSLSPIALNILLPLVYRNANSVSHPGTSRSVCYLLHLLCQDEKRGRKPLPVWTFRKHTVATINTVNKNNNFEGGMKDSDEVEVSPRKSTSNSSCFCPFVSSDSN